MDTENAKAGGAEARYLLDRFASLEQSYKRCKKTIDFLKSGQNGGIDI